MPAFPPHVQHNWPATRATTEKMQAFTAPTVMGVNYTKIYTKKCAKETENNTHVQQ